MKTILIQAILDHLGYDTGGIGNGWGKKSQAAALAFQGDYKAHSDSELRHGLLADGIVGPQTTAALLEAVATKWEKPRMSQSVTGEENAENADSSTVAESATVPNSPETPDSSSCSEIPNRSFWDDIRYFKRSEFRCPCGHCSGFPAEPEEKLIRLADRTRSYFGAPITVSSGVRCAAHNAEVGGVSNSRHLLGKAMDFSVRGFSAAQILAYVQHLKGIRYAYAIDGSYVHMDVE